MSESYLSFLNIFGENKMRKFSKIKLIILLTLGLVLSIIIGNNFSNNSINTDEDVFEYPENRININSQDSRELVSRWP